VGCLVYATGNINSSRAVSPIHGNPRPNVHPLKSPAGDCDTDAYTDPEGDADRNVCPADGDAYGNTRSACAPSYAYTAAHTDADVDINAAGRGCARGQGG
jgi:hypothetical protein